jgi:hypothetical protein
MNKCMKAIAALLLAAAISVSLGGCGGGEGGGYLDGGSPIPATVSVKSGTLLSDSWGQTGGTPVALAAPAGTAVVVEGRSLLLDDNHAVVSGASATEVRFSSDVTTLSQAAQAAAPTGFLSYLSFSIGEVQTVSPAMSVSLDAATLAVGDAFTVYRYDSAARSWKSVLASTVASNGKINFQVTGPGLYGVFR